MNITSLVIGGLFLAFGIGSIPARIKNPDGAGKLRAMQERLGKDAGYRAHVFFYTVVPLVMGVLTLILGVMGISYF
jgi:hypothetical protein